VNCCTPAVFDLANKCFNAVAPRTSGASTPRAATTAPTQRNFVKSRTHSSGAWHAVRQVLRDAIAEASKHPAPTVLQIVSNGDFAPEGRCERPITIRASSTPGVFP
jgi:hypothetical protein